VHEILERSYGDLTAIAGRLSAEQAWAATGCRACSLMRSARSSRWRRRPPANPTVMR